MRLLFSSIAVCSLLLFGLSVAMVFISDGYGYAVAFAVLTVSSAIIAVAATYIAIRKV